MSGSTVVAIGAIRHTLFVELDARVKNSMYQELEEFKRLHLEHRLIEGDTLAEIAGRFGITVEALVEANNIVDIDRIEVGDVLAIPPTP